MGVGLLKSKWISGKMVLETEEYSWRENTEDPEEDKIE